jgi:hypothetical protein
VHAISAFHPTVAGRKGDPRGRLRGMKTVPAAPAERPLLYRG